MMVNVGFVIIKPNIDYQICEFVKLSLSLSCLNFDIHDSHI